MPVHAHLRDFPLSSLTKNGTPRIHLFTGSPTTKRAPKLGSEPRTGGVDLARSKVSLRLVQRDVLPVGANRGKPAILLAERRLQKDGVVREDGGDRLDVAALPPFPEPVHQLPIALTHARTYTPPLRWVALLVGLAACRPAADEGFTLLFFGRSS